LQQRLHDASVIAREDNATAPATTTATAPTTPSPRVCCVHNKREAAAVDGILQTPAGASGTTTAPSKMAAVLKALPLRQMLPLLSIPFLPPPMAVLVVLSSLATPVRACSDEPSDDYCSGSGLTHATCTVYRYLHDSGTIDRAQPFADLRAVCPHPLCNAGSDERALSTAYGHRRGRRDDPFHGYCSVNTLVVGVVPETGDRCLCSVRVHLPVADPAAVVAAGADVCYVELEHMNYREGYYIFCPVRDCYHEPVVCCTEFPHDAIAATVWEHRSLIYRHALGWYNNDTASPQLEGEVYHDEL
jgi:hypothetical protein